MSFPAPSALLRHRPPALVLARIDRRDGARLVCTGVDRDWDWPALLEGCAQAAGLLAGMLPGGPSNAALIAEYRDVVVDAPAWVGAVTFEAVFDRRILGFWRHAAVARAGDGTRLLSTLVTLAPRETPA